MSRDTKIKDTKRILTGINTEKELQLFYNVGDEGCIPLSREAIKYYADEACLEACKLLYDLNIKTIFSGANVDGKENTNSTAFIGISYDTLSDENKSIALSLIENEIIEGISNNSGRYQGNVICITIPINSNDTVGFVSDKLISIASHFVQQDVLYGKTTEKIIRTQFKQLENGNFIDYMTFAEITPEELEERIKDEVSQFYSDEQGNLFFTEDLLKKHLNYQMSKNKEDNNKSAINC